MKDRKVGQILTHILQNNLEISAIELFYLDKPSSEEFLEIYKSLIPEISEMVNDIKLGERADNGCLYCSGSQVSECD